jgi:hypothetical protein
MFVYVLALEADDVNNALQVVLVGTIDAPCGSIGPRQGQSTRQK